MNKINKSHLKKSAHIYVRQSTMGQVQNNLESQRRQYKLADRAHALGWTEVQIVDEDLGRSAGGHIERSGFERLVADVGAGKVGAIFAIEASRLARNGYEWHRLLDFCAIVGVLIIDHDGVYDPRSPNDRLLLGLKGTMSELEIWTFRQRSQEAIIQKAKRGELYLSTPAGYVRTGNGGLEKDPDGQVQASIDLVFRKFREYGSARQVFLWLVQERIEIPRREQVSKPVGAEFVRATQSLVLRLLKNPIYAGVYAFGRTRQRTVIENGRKNLVKERNRQPEDWQVLIKAHHDGYITWEEYLKNQDTLRHNMNKRGETVRGSARRGKGLLTGVVRCGRCGRKMHVRYSGRAGRNSAVVYYACPAPDQGTSSKQLCSIFGGVTVEDAVTRAVLDALSLVNIDAMARATERLEENRNEKVQQVELQLERARYEAGRCERQYNGVEPENRIVARTLECAWNRSLEKVQQIEDELQHARDQRRVISDEERRQVRQLAHDLPRLWEHPAASFDLKKRVLRSVVKEVIVYVGKTTLRVLIHWHGGQHTELNLRKRRVGEHRWKTNHTTQELIGQLARQMADKEIAAHLNRMGIKSAKGHTWTRIRVGNFRNANDIANYTPGEREIRGEVTIEEAAAMLDVSYSTVSRMIQRKELPAYQICPGSPWVILSKDVEAIAMRRAAQQRGGTPSSACSNQLCLELQ